MATYIILITLFYQNYLRLWLYYMLETIWLHCKNMQNLAILDVFEISITQKLLKCPTYPFVRSALTYFYWWTKGNNHKLTCLGAQWLSGRVLDSRPHGCGFKPHRCHCVVSLSKTQLSLLSTGSTQEDPSRHNWKIVDWDVKNQIKQTCFAYLDVWQKG